MKHTSSPYLLDEPPTSTGRALLARAFAHWCGLHFGHSPEDIAAAFDPDDPAGDVVRRDVGGAARLLGELIAAGHMKTYARPFGGGSPVPLREGDWELDDFRPRMARSALDPKRPFEDAEPTHWIFVQLEDFNRIVEESCSDLVPSVATPARTAPPGAAADTSADGDAAAASAANAEGRLVRIPELVRRTGMSKSTIYRRIEEGRFPQRLDLDGNIAAWRESDVAAWLASPR